MGKSAHGLVDIMARRMPATVTADDNDVLLLLLLLLLFIKMRCVDDATDERRPDRDVMPFVNAGTLVNAIMVTDTHRERERG